MLAIGVSLKCILNKNQSTENPLVNMKSITMNNMDCQNVTLP